MKSIFIYIILFTTNICFGQNIFNNIQSKNYVELYTQLKNGGQTELYNEIGLTPLWMAVFKNDSISVKILLKNGANVNGLTKKGLPPIMAGSMVNAFESVKILLKNGADINWRSAAVKNQQAIRFASNNGTIEFVQMLLDAGANIESTADDGCTPLLAAVYSNNYNLAKYYFEKGSNVNVYARDGECVIHEAIKTKNPKMVKLALKYNSPLEYKDQKGKNTLEKANATGDKKIQKMIKTALKEQITTLHLKHS